MTSVGGTTTAHGALGSSSSLGGTASWTLCKKRVGPPLFLARLHGTRTFYEKTMKNDMI